MASRGLVVVGWYHSHPYSEARPSQNDVLSHKKYQDSLKTEAGEEPCVGLIISETYVVYIYRHKRGRLPHSFFTLLWTLRDSVCMRGSSCVWSVSVCTWLLCANLVLELSDWSILRPRVAVAQLHMHSYAKCTGVYNTWTIMHMHPLTAIA